MISNLSKLFYDVKVINNEDEISNYEILNKLDFKLDNNINLKNNNKNINLLIKKDNNINLKNNNDKNINLKNEINKKSDKIIKEIVNEIIDKIDKEDNNFNKSKKYKYIKLYVF